MKRVLLLTIMVCCFCFTSSNAQYLNWAKHIGGGDHDCNGYSIATDGAGNVYTCGVFYDSINFNTGGSSFYLKGTPGYGAAFLQKTDASGNFAWAFKIGDTSTVIPFSLVTDATGNIYMEGMFTGGVDFYPGVATYNMTANGGFDVFVVKFDHSGNFIWANQFGSIAPEYCYSMAADHQGNIVLAGIFEDITDFNPSAAVYNLTPVGRSDIFVEKLDSAGHFVWAKQLGGAGPAAVNGVSADRNGNVYLTGTFDSTADFDPGAGVSNLTNNGVFVCKLTSAGDLSWAKQFGVNTHEAASAITVNDNAVFTTGSFLDTVDFDPGAATYNMISTGFLDIYVQKLDTNGNFIWAKKMGGNNWDLSRAIVGDAFGDIYITGIYTDTTDFDPGVGVYNMVAHHEWLGVYIVKLDRDGNFVWADNFVNTNGTYGQGEGLGLAIDNSNHVLATGYFEGTVDFDPGAGSMNYTNVNGGVNDAYILKLTQPPVSILDPNQISTTLQLYPNPTTDIINVICPSAIERIQITDAMGRLVYTAQPISKNTSIKIDIPGVYIVKAISNATLLTGKFVVCGK